MRFLIYTLLFCTLFTQLANAKVTKKVKPGDIHHVVVQCPPKQLRTPGRRFEIGISVVLKNGKELSTKGHLEGTLRWRNFRIEVDKGSYSAGNITLNECEGYLKDEYITVTVYTRRGNEVIGKQEIPYHYEDSLEFLTSENIVKAPGFSFDFGIRTHYNNGMYEDYRNLSNLKQLSPVSVTAQGAFIHKDKVRINADPFSLQNHQVVIHYSLEKCPSVGGSFLIPLDYKANYKKGFYGLQGISGADGSKGYRGAIGSHGESGGNGGNGQHGSHGPNVNVYTYVYYDTILQQKLMHAHIVNEFHDRFDFLINTQGGSLKVFSRGGKGGDGGDGGRGGRGGYGEDAQVYREERELNDSTIEVIEWQEDPGMSGGNGGHGGHGGYGGDGGIGGDITIFYDPSAEPFLDLIQAYSYGGWAGNGGSGGPGGRAGKGGSGNPTGADGYRGNPGEDGGHGYEGVAGKVYFESYNAFE